MKYAPIEFTVSLKDFDPEAHKKIAALRAEIKKVEDDVVRRFRQTDRFRAACDLAGFNDYGGKKNVSLVVGLSGITVKTKADVTRLAPTLHPSPRSIHIAESTANTLLSGKLLSDAEKRKLVESLTGGVISAEPEVTQ